MTNEFELDLDVYQPKPGIVTLGGKKYEVYPPKFKNLVTLISTISKLQETEAEAIPGEAAKPGEEAKPDEKKKSFSIEDLKGQMEVLKNALMPLMPALAEPEIDLDMDQLGRLIRFVISMATPQDAEKLKQAGITIEPSGEKKSGTDAQIS